MKVNHIKIKNFKGVGGLQSIDLRKITLLFGPNSAGKSTIIQALQYMREILERGNLDPDRLLSGGTADLGGFTALVHKHDLDKSVYVELGVDVNAASASDFLGLNSGEYRDNLEFTNLRIKYLSGGSEDFSEDTIVKTVNIGLEISWSRQERRPYVSKVISIMNGMTVAEIISSAQPGRAKIANINYEHPLLQSVYQPGISESQSLTVENFEQDELIIETSPLEEEITDLSRLLNLKINEEKSRRDYRLSEHKLITEQRYSNVERANAKLTKFKAEDVVETYEAEAVAIETRLGALPSLSETINIDLREINANEIKDIEDSIPNSLKIPGTGYTRYSIEQETSRRKGIRILLDELLMGPARIALKCLSNAIYLGPLREVPNREYKPQLSPDTARWSSGLAAWDILTAQNDDQLLAKVNRWMSSEDGLATGFEVSYSESKRVLKNSALHRLFDRGVDEDSIDDLIELYKDLPVERQLGLVDQQYGLYVSPKDVGIGISQILPIVVACTIKPTGLVAIEQPELHIHPAIQVNLGDLFIEASSESEDSTIFERTLLVETHSEHLMLRLLRRIRENYDDELPPRTMGMVPEELSVVYVEPSSSGTNFRKLRITDDGDFLDEWPKGFFEERGEELF